MKDYMVAVERFIHPEGPAIRACGFVNRDLTHFHGVPHTTVLIMPVRVTQSGNMEILIHRRPQDKKVSPDTWDTFGGHVEVSIQDGKLLLPGDRVLEDKGRSELYQLIDSTAVREANEEIKISDYQFSKNNVHRFGGYGDFEYGTDTPGAENVEYSTVFVAVLPSAVSIAAITAEDSVGRGGVEVIVSNLKLELVTLEYLLAEYHKKPSEFADGLGRILQQLVKVPGTRRSFEAFLQKTVEV